MFENFKDTEGVQFVEPGQWKTIAEEQMQKKRQEVLFKVRKLLDSLLSETDDHKKLLEQQIITTGPWIVTGPTHKRGGK
jgi:hypothetical protein